VPECHGFGPENRNDFFVKPGDPITGTTTVRINPKVAAPNWHTKYEAAYKAGKMKIVIVVRYDDSDEVLSSRESHEKTISVVIPV
jgi:hypothetical protein